MLEIIQELHHNALESCQTEQFRHLFQQVKLDNRMTGLIGPRGVGKTTLMLQYIKTHLNHNNDVIYFSADLVHFEQHTLFDIVRELHIKEGYQYFFIDEIHQYHNWQQELKNLYDGYPKITLVFSGSSMLDLIKGSYDLSRRAKLYHLQGLSFREYLNFNDQIALPAISFETLINHYNEIPKLLNEVEQIGKKFQDYLKIGYYPFVFENRDSYTERLLRVIDKTIYEDIAKFYNLKTSNLHLFKKILGFLASIPPGKVNVNNLAESISMSHQSTAHYISILQEVGLIKTIYSNQTGHAALRKPEKIFLSNTNLMYTLAKSKQHANTIGTMRELLFVQSLTNKGFEVHYSKTGDYEVSEYLFEIGGPAKTRKQLKSANLPAFVVKDDILYPGKNTLPLMYFALLY